MGEAVDEDRLQQPLEVVERPARHGYAEDTHTHTQTHTFIPAKKKNVIGSVSQEEQNGTNSSFVLPSSEELRVWGKK